LFVHTRDFHYPWEARVFYPAGYIEWFLIRAHPQFWLPHPSWATYPQVLLLEAQDYRATFPCDAFRKKIKPIDEANGPWSNDRKRACHRPRPWLISVSLDGGETCWNYLRSDRRMLGRSQFMAVEGVDLALCRHVHLPRRVSAEHVFSTVLLSTSGYFTDP
jgi:hypothetical protein